MGAEIFYLLMTLPAFVFGLLALAAGVRGSSFFPAFATNDTGHLTYSNDSIYVGIQEQLAYGNYVSRQVTATGNGNTTYSNGALMHYTVNEIQQGRTSIPWIALISCDSSTATAFENSAVSADLSVAAPNTIFDLVYEQGASAVLLYSEVSQYCAIDPTYTNGSLTKSLDVYTSLSSSESVSIENLYNYAYQYAYTFNATLINLTEAQNAVLDILTSDVLTVHNGTESVANMADLTPVPTSTSESASSTAAMVSASASATSSAPAEETSSSLFGRRIVRRTTSSPFFIGAVLTSMDVYVGDGFVVYDGTSSSGGTNLAMVILYVVTGIVSFLFVLVIVLGTIRAIRYPDRYGRRRAQLPSDGNIHGVAQQTRAQGLTRAILDTFPVVKWRKGDEATGEVKDIDSDSDIEMMAGARQSVGTRTSAGGMGMRLADETAPTGGTPETRDAGTRVTHEEAATGAVAATQLSAAAATVPLPTDNEKPPIPAPKDKPTAVVRPVDSDADAEASGSTCPICMCDFEEDEEVRVLPCDRRHQFHKDCIDPWLLQVSTACPLCRLDFAYMNEEGPGAEAEIGLDSGSETPAYSGPGTPAEAGGLEHHGSRWNVFRRNRERSNTAAAPEDSDALAAQLRSYVARGPGTGHERTDAIASRTRFFRLIARDRRSGATPATPVTSRQAQRTLQESPWMGEGIVRPEDEAPEFVDTSVTARDRVYAGARQGQYPLV